MKNLFIMTAIMLSSLSFANNPFNVKIKTFEGKQTLTNFSMCEGTLTLISSNDFGYTFYLSGPATNEKLWLFINGTDSYEVVNTNSNIHIGKFWFNPEKMDNEDVYNISVSFYSSWPITPSTDRICYAVSGLIQ
ncbi:hypothetical protein HX001_14315 [Empedobacter brevis]|uniref:Uncharacterized protein n=1 Tax=Empedobacter brevis TaxID=247 RepID=A0AAJ1QGI7_9FLAO|nr:hypothetical protein [Empedobacter brevis]MDM1073660.1 hypothetical protein [Empedobacter brevis]